MSIQYVNAAGQPVNIAELAQKHKPPPKAAASALKRTHERDKAKVSDGFVVTGYSQEQMQARDADYLEAKARFDKGELRAKAPGTLDEFTARWMSKNKPKRARSKPYEIEQAADQCAELMRKAGWLYVRVDELMKA